MGTSPPNPPLALTMGEAAGIGLDVTIEAWRRRDEAAIPPFYLLADPAAVQRRAALLGAEIEFTATDAGKAAAVFADALPVVSLSNSVEAVPAQPSTVDAAMVQQSIERAVADVRSGAASAVVTNPINKAVMLEAGFRHPGHTEFLAELATGWTGTAPKPVMMLAGPELRTVPVTIHIPLRDVPERLSTALIVETGVIVDTDLKRRFGLARPRIAVTGLNPHAGEEGRLGAEDQTIVAPAVAALRQRGIEASGPFPADTLFHAAARSGYDVAMCMYHDQALIPAKTLAFDEAVNVTLGLPFIRTSPDHGTAFGLAGSGRANPGSLIAALKLAAAMVVAEARG